MAQHALFSGTFDPVTLGHLDVLERAVRLFGRVTLGVALNPAKEPLFPLEERMSLLREVTAGIEEVGIVHVTGRLLPDTEGFVPDRLMIGSGGLIGRLLPR